MLAKSIKGLLRGDMFRRKEMVERYRYLNVEVLFIVDKVWRKAEKQRWGI